MLLAELTEAEASLDACRLAHGGKPDLVVEFVGQLAWTYSDWDPSFTHSARSAGGPTLPVAFSAPISFDILFHKYAHVALDVSAFGNDPSAAAALVLQVPGFPDAAIYALSVSVTEAHFSFASPAGGTYIGEIFMRLEFDYNYDGIVSSLSPGTATALAYLAGHIKGDGTLELGAAVTLAALSPIGQESLVDPPAVNTHLGSMEILGSVSDFKKI